MVINRNNNSEAGVSDPYNLSSKNTIQIASEPVKSHFLFIE